MPIYEYRCSNGHVFEVTQSMSADPVTTCQVCGAPVERVFHPIAVHFKGSGFYTTDYGRGRAGVGSGDSGGDDSGDSSKAGAKSGSGGSSDSKSSSDSKGSGDSKGSSDSTGSGDKGVSTKSESKRSGD